MICWMDEKLNFFLLGRMPKRLIHSRCLVKEGHGLCMGVGGRLGRGS